MPGGARRAKLFIKVDGVIGDRKRICTFCNTAIDGVEKIVETTRKLRHGPYFPQLAYLQSAIGKIDTLGRAVVCLPCFHQLLRQWRTHEHRNVPVSRRTYKYVSDKGVKNYEETRAFEIRTEAEKRAFAIYTKQEHIVKKSFVKLTNLLDTEEALIQTNEERISELNRELVHCSRGERWKIECEIRKLEKLIRAAELRIEEEEDKEEEIREETKALLDVYRNNSSLFRSFSEPNLLKTDGKLNTIIPEQDIDCLVDNRGEDLEHNTEEFDAVDGSPVTMNEKNNTAFDKYNEQNDRDYHSVVIAKRVALSDDETDGYDFNTEHVGRHEVDQVDVWSGLKGSERVKEERGSAHPTSEWNLVKEVIYPVQSEVQSFPDDVWSKLFIQEQQADTESYSQSKDELVQEKRDIGVYSENKPWEEEDTDDSDEEREQVYEVNSNVGSAHKFPVSEHFEQNKTVGTSYGMGKIHKDGLWKIADKTHVETIQTSSTSNDVFLDPWDNIQIEREDEYDNDNEKIYPQYSAHGQSKDDNYSNEYNQDIDNRNDKEVLSPGRLNFARFSEFTKSSYIPLPVKEQPSRERLREDDKSSPEQKFTIQRINKTNTEVTIIERKNRSTHEQGTKAFQERNDPIEVYERKDRNTHERHLSVEEEEWERKHLSPTRLDESRWLTFLNDASNGSVKRPEVDSTAAKHQKSRVYTEENNERLNKRLDDRSAQEIERSTEVRVERSPALRKLIRQDEMGVVEQPFQKIATKGTLQSDPWDDIGSKMVSQNSDVKNEPNQSLKDTSSANIVGRLDLKRWSSEVGNNRMFAPGRGDETSSDVIKETRSRDYSRQNSLPANRVYDDNISFNKQTIVSPRIKDNHETIIIDAQGRTAYDDVEDLRKKPVGKINLNLWQQNGSTQFQVARRNEPCGTSKTSPIVETKRTLTSPKQKHTFETLNDKRNSFKFKDSERSMNDNQPTTKSLRLDDTTQSKSSNVQRPNNLTNSYETNNRSRVFNQSMSEDELAWENRFSKSPKRDSFEEVNEDHGMRRKISDPRTPRLTDGDLDQNENFLNIGKLVLDEEEVRRVRNGGHRGNIRNGESKMSLTTSIDRKNRHRQTWSGTSTPKQSEKIKYNDVSQLSQEEKSWEERTSRPGKLDFSKFSHFS